MSIEKDQKSVPIPIQHQYTFHTLKIKYNLVFDENLTKKLITSHKIDPKIYFPAETEYPKNGTSYTPIYGSCLLPIEPGNDVREKLGKHLVVNRFIAAHSLFDI